MKTPFAIALTAGGTLAAIVAIPDNPQPEGALFWPAVFLTGGLLGVIAMRMRRDVQAILRADNLVMVGLVYWLLLDPLQSSYPFWGVSWEAAATAFGAIGLFAAAVLAAAPVQSVRPPKFVLRSVATSVPSRDIVRAIVVCFALGMFYFAWSSNFDLWVMIENLGASRFEAVWSRGALGGWSAFVDHLIYFGYALPALTVILAQRRGWLHPSSLAALAMTVVMVLFIAQGGGRRLPGMLVGSGLLSWLLMQRHLGLRKVAAGMATLATLLAGLQVMLQARDMGFAEYFAAEQVETLDTLRVDDNLLRLSQIVAIFPTVHDYAGVQPIVYPAVLPVPRVFWPEKPVDPGYDLPNLVGMEGLTLTSSIVGELYASYGLFAVLFGGLAIGWLCAMLNYILVRAAGATKPLVLGLGMMTLFLALRSIRELVLMSYALLGWFIIARLLLARKHRAPRAAQASLGP